MSKPKVTRKEIEALLLESLLMIRQLVQTPELNMDYLEDRTLAVLTAVADFQHRTAVTGFMCAEEENIQPVSSGKSAHGGTL